MKAGARIEMKITVKFFASVREIVGKKEETIELPEGATVETVLQKLVQNYGPKFKDYVYDEKLQTPRNHLQFLVDGRSVTTLEGIKTKLRDGNQFAIIPPVGGGRDGNP